jgi:putative DNA primase/helicase
VTGASPYSDNALTAHDLKRIGLALGGQPDGKGWRARCPVHDDHNPSLSLRSGDTVPLLVKCWAGCDPRDILAELRRRGLLDDERSDWKPRTIRTNPRAVEPDRATLRYLLELLRPIEGTLVDAYLDSRGLERPPLGHHLRFLPARPPKHIWPSMVGIITDFADAEHVLSLHFTRLKPDGSSKASLPKHEQRSYLAGYRKKGGVIRLCDDADVTLSLGLGEGVETSLSVFTAFRRAGWFRPMWAALDAGNMAALLPLRGIDQLFIYADRGPAGEQAADKFAQRWLEAPTEVLVSTAPVDDWNPPVESSV